MPRPLRPFAATASARAAAGGLALTLVAGLLVPIYTDEVTWRMQLSRSTIDGGLDRGLGDQCGPASVIAAPWFMQPMRHLSAAANLAFADPAWVRIGGVLLALVWVALVWRLGARIGEGARAIVLAMAGLGVLPFLLVWSRPEQPLLLCYTGALLIALARRPRPIIAAVAIVALGIITLGYHPKAIVFVPILLVAAALSSRGVARIGAIAVLIGCTLVAYRYWTTRLACPGDPLIAAKLAAENVGAAGGGSVLARLAVLADNARPWGYINHVLPSPDYMSSWLPHVAIPGTLGFVWQRGLRLLWRGIAWGTLILVVARAAWEVVRRCRIARETWLAGTIVAVLLAWGATQTNKNAYEAALVLPLLAIALALAVPWHDPHARRAASACGVTLSVLALTSQALLIGFYAPSLARTTRTPGPIADQPFSFAPWHYAALRGEMLAAARACAIDPARAHDLMIDDMTYFPAIASARPQHRMALTGPWAGSIGDPIAYLAARKSSGILVACTSLPPGIRARVHAVGRFCCLGAPGA